MFQWLLDEVSGHPVTYLVVFVAAGGDVLFPPIPSETVVIAAGIVAAKGGLSIELLIPATAVGAFAGDNVCYWLGSRLGDPMARRVLRGEQRARRLQWAETAIQRHGSLIVLIGRFIPGGRTASTFAAGTLEMRWRRFAAADATAAIAWAIYASMLGYLGGSAFGDSSWKPFVASLGAAAAIGGLGEGWRRIQRRRGRDILGDAL